MYAKLNESDQKELDVLNDKVKEAVEQRKEWLEKKMIEYAKFQIGEEIYALNIHKYGGALGTVSEFYLYPEPQEFRKEELNICYQYETSRNCYSNTSSQEGACFVTKQEYIEFKQKELDYITSK